MAYYHMAMACGINIMPSRLLEENGRAHFMTKRFDREGGAVKHHIQTFVLWSTLTITWSTVLVMSNSFSVCEAWNWLMPMQSRCLEEWFLMWLPGIVTTIPRIFLLLRQGGQWELAPAYDICHAYRPGSEWVSQHALSINGKRKEITRADLLVIGKSIRCKKHRRLLTRLTTQSINGANLQMRQKWNQACVMK